METLNHKLAKKCIEYIHWNQIKIINTSNYARECFNTLRWELLINIISKFINPIDISIYHSRIQSVIMNYQPVYVDNTFSNQIPNKIYLECFEYNLINSLIHNNFSNQSKQNIIECFDILLNTDITLEDINTQNNLKYEKKVILFHKKLIPHFIGWIKEHNKSEKLKNDIQGFCNIVSGYQFNYTIDYNNYNYGLFLIDLEKCGLFQNDVMLENVINYLENIENIP